MLKRRRDDGSVAVAMAVIMILSMLVIGGLARTLGTLKAARSSQDFDANLTHADSAVSDVLFRLDQGETGTLTSDATETRFKYVATPVAGPAGVDQYLVKSKGILNGRPHAIRVTLERRRRFPYAIYARTLIDLSQGGTPTICGKTDPVSGAYYPAIIGSSGSIKGASSGGQPTVSGVCGTFRAAEGQDLFATGSGPFSCSNCYNTPAVGVYRSPDAQLGLDPAGAPILDDVTTAPAGAVTRCSFSGAIASGTYTCTGNITFTADTTVPQTGDPVKIYQLGNFTLNLAQRRVNYSGSPSVAGNSAQLQIYKGGTGVINIGSGGTTELSAVVHAPFSTLTPDGQTFHFAGSIVLDSYVYNGQTDFTFSYNRNAASVTRDWIPRNYREIPSSQVP